jgi:regulator of sigma E protease
MLTTLLAFIAAIIVVVAVHEYGHYLAMRLFGVRVLTFSVGFGPRLLSWRDRHGTDFVISGIPLGGYVKPLDRHDSDVPDEDRAGEFSGKPAWQRIITYAAGPLANLVLAWFIFWVILLGGETALRPIAGAPEPGSAADLAGFRHGDIVLAVAGREVDDWNDVPAELMRHLGEQAPVPVTVGRGQETATLALDIGDWSADPEQHPFPVLGLKAAAQPPLVGAISDGSPARQAGLQEGDLVLAVNGEEIASFGDWVVLVRDNPGRPLETRVRRDARELTLTVVPEPVEQAGETIGRVGVAVAGLKKIHYGPLSAVPAAAERLWDQTSLIVGAMGKLVTGKLSLETLSGPISIADAAGKTAAVGVVAFLGFMAFLSVSLGVINLMPVPMLDGGWIVFGLVEMLRGRPLSDRFLANAQVMGMMFVFSLMMLAIYNDLMRQFA